jgi:hypothetical protein
LSPVFARILSYIGHPLLMLTYTLLVMLYANPYSFGAHTPGDRKAMVFFISVFFCTFLLPAIGVLMMKFLGFIQSFEMEDKQERIGPYILTGVFYLWLYKNLMTAGADLYASFTLGAVLGLFVAFFINIFTKISAHTTGAGGLVVMILILTFEWSGASITLPFWGGNLQLTLLAVLALVIVFAGLIGSARLRLGAHTPQQLWGGYLVGAATMWVASFFA